MSISKSTGDRMVIHVDPQTARAVEVAQRFLQSGKTLADLDAFVRHSGRMIVRVDERTAAVVASLGRLVRGGR